MALNILIVDDSALTRKAIRRIIGMLDLDVGEVIEAEDGLRASQGRHSIVPSRPPGRSRGLSADWPTGNHPRRHGPGELAVGRPAGEHAAHVRLDLSRRRPRNEPHGRDRARPRAHQPAGVQIVFTWRYSSKPSTPCSRPMTL